MFEFFVESILTLIQLFVLYYKYNALLGERTGELVERAQGNLLWTSEVLVGLGL